METEDDSIDSPSGHSNDLRETQLILLDSPVWEVENYPGEHTREL